MKFSVEKSVLEHALTTVQNVVPNRGTLQILSNALIKAENGRLYFSTTDLDISVVCSIVAEVEVGGATTLPIHRFSNIVSDLNGSVVDVEIENDTAVITCGASYFKIIGLPAADFPQIPQPEGSVCYKLSVASFKGMLQKTAYAASDDETRRVLTGVLLQFKDDKLTVVATDGRRLALSESEIEIPADSESEIVLPKKAVNELIRMLPAEGDLVIYRQKSQVLFEVGETRLSTKLIDGSFPNYKQVIPDNCDVSISVEREELISALKRMLNVTTDRSNSVKLMFKANHLEIESKTQDVGEGRESVPLKYNGEKIEATFNPKYIIEPLQTLDDDEIQFELSNGHSPALIKCGQPFIYVLMPLRVN